MAAQDEKPLTPGRPKRGPLSPSRGRGGRKNLCLPSYRTARMNPGPEASKNPNSPGPAGTGEESLGGSRQERGARRSSLLGGVVGHVVSSLLAPGGARKNPCSHGPSLPVRQGALVTHPSVSTIGSFATEHEGFCATVVGASLKKETTIPRERGEGGAHRSRHAASVGRSAGVCPSPQASATRRTSIQRRAPHPWTAVTRGTATPRRAPHPWTAQARPPLPVEGERGEEESFFPNLMMLRISRVIL